MKVVEVTVRGPVAVIPSGRVLPTLGDEFGGFVAELGRLAGAGALPARVEPTDDGWCLVVHTSRLVAWLFPTGRGDAYRLGKVAPRQFRDEQRLVERAMMLRIERGFTVYRDVRAVNQGQAGWSQLSGHGQELLAAWRCTEQADASPAGPSAHDRYLDLLTLVVEAARTIELDQQSAVPLQPYAARSDARVQRHSSRGVYRFRMVGRTQLVKGTAVGLGDSGMRGQVIRIDGRDVTVRFEPGADYGQIPAQGVLKVLPGDRVYRAQLDAIATLRRGGARNMGVFTSLADAVFQPFQPASAVVAQRSLDAGQLEAFRRALTVPDVLCVLGPPGTGKTTTITEVARSCAAAGQRVLITSHTNRAVDNVLERLPADLHVVRVGSEDKMSARVRPLSAERRAEAARQDILGDTTMLDLLTEVGRRRPLAQHHLDELAARLTEAGPAEAVLQHLQGRLADAVRSASAPLHAQIDQAARALAAHRSTVNDLSVALRDRDARLQRAEVNAGKGPIWGMVLGWYTGWLRRRIGALRDALAAATAAAEQAASTEGHLRRQADAMAASDPAVQALTSRRDAAHQDLQTAFGHLTRTGQQVTMLLRPAVDPPPNPEPTVADWTAFHRTCTALLDVVERRAVLLAQWRERINDLGNELEHEIARYADVVGATAIGTDTSALISDLDFDLAIVDEAGQISTPNLLVPLVRASRVVLVGDHHQLPPYLDDDLRTWGSRLAPAGGLTAAEIRDVTGLLTHSGFERLFATAPDTNKVMLTTQRRMPAPIADFVSTTFYSGRLRTEHAGGWTDPLFKAPFAMLDTSDQPAADRAETAMSGRGDAIEHGYRNELEADLIASLLRHYQHHYRDWAVIVPFNAQKALLLDRLHATLDPGADLDASVGSVDSFQGGERDLIIFGFTRSNPAGDIGFLKEVRRFNVAISRAKQQLVLVGDLSTLRRASKQPFRDVMHAMHQHLDKSGDLRPSRTMAVTLRQRQER